MRRRDKIRSVKPISVMSLVLVAVTAGSVRIAFAAPGNVGSPITKTEAIAFAQAVNLSASDLPGARQVTLPETEAKNALSKELRCARPGIVTHRPVGADTSTLLDAQGGVASLVRVMPTEAIAAAELAAFASRRGHVCFARGATPKDEPGEVSDLVKATFVPLVKLLGSGAIGVHTVSKPPHTPKSAALHVDGVLFRVGPVEILFVSYGTAQFPPATEGRLLALLHGRAEEHKL